MKPLARLGTLARQQLWPRSMLAQLSTLLLAGLLLAHGLAWLVLYTDHDTLHPISRNEVLDRLGAAARVVQATAQHEQAAVVEALSSADARFWLAASPVLGGPMDPTEQQLANDIQQLLVAPHKAVRVHLLRSQALDEPGHLTGELPPLDDGGAAAVPGATALVAAVELANGQWLHSRQRTVVRTQWWRPFRVSLPVSVAPVLLLAIVFVRRLLRPLRALARAAEQFSRGERMPPLVVEGPRETRELTRTFNAMQERLSRYVNDRTRMLAAISHDFRTPLTALRLRAELVEDAGLREGMVRSLDDLRQMVDETLQFARDDAATEATQAFDLAELVREVVAEQQVLGHAVQLLAVTACPGRWRPLSLKRALNNLIDNAVRHGGQAEVLVQHLPGEGVFITIDDNGPGIPAQRLAEAFMPFTRLDDAARQQQGAGSGLGLAIARSCIKAHGGQVSLVNRPGGGLQARVTLP